jgi:hypothetical protein
MNQIIVFGCLMLFLSIAGTLISISISYSKCSKYSASASLWEGTIWAFPITLVYVLLNLEQTKPYVMPIFSGPFSSYSSSPELIGSIYALILMTCIVTARMFHTTDVAVCIPSKDELKEFSKKLSEELKEKLHNK